MSIRLVETPVPWWEKRACMRCGHPRSAHFEEGDRHPCGHTTVATYASASCLCIDFKERL